MEKVTTKRMALYSGRTHPTLAAEVAEGLGARLALFYRQVIAELRKVIWPTRRELITYTTVVIVFVAAVATIVAVLDLIFAKGVLAVFGS